MPTSFDMNCRKGSRLDCAMARENMSSLCKMLEERERSALLMPVESPQRVTLSEFEVVN